MFFKKFSCNFFIIVVVVVVVIGLLIYLCTNNNIDKFGQSYKGDTYKCCCSWSVYRPGGESSYGCQDWTNKTSYDCTKDGSIYTECRLPCNKITNTTGESGCKPDCRTWQYGCNPDGTDPLKVCCGSLKCKKDWFGKHTCQQW